MISSVEEEDQQQLRVRGTMTFDLCVFGNQLSITSLVAWDSELVRTLSGPQANVAGEGRSSVNHLKECVSKWTGRYALRRHRCLAVDALNTYLSILEENYVNSQIPQNRMWIIKIPAVEHVSIFVLSYDAGAKSRECTECLLAWDGFTAPLVHVRHGGSQHCPCFHQKLDSKSYVRRYFIGKVEHDDVGQASAQMSGQAADLPRVRLRNVLFQSHHNRCNCMVDPFWNRVTGKQKKKPKCPQSELDYLLS